MHFTALHKIVQGLHCLLNWGVRIIPVDLQQIDVIGAESFQTRINCLEDGCSAKTTAVNIVFALVHFLSIENTTNARCLANETIAFGEDDQFITWNIVMLDSFSDDLFRYTIGIYISSVPSV